MVHGGRMPKDQNNYRSERVRSRLSAKQVGEALDVSEYTIRSWERGDTEPTSTQLKGLSELYGCTMDYLVGLTDERLAS